MTPPADSQELLDRYLDRALDAGPEGWDAILREVRADHPDVASDFERLLSHAGEDHGVLDAGAASILGPAFLSAPPSGDAPGSARVEGREVGRYRLVAPLGRGGMGRVFLAERTDGLYSQRVALKVLRWELASDEAAARFRMEREILATLDHPGIGRLVDGGVTDDGLPYLVMEFVDGAPADVWAGARGLDLEARLELVEQVCAAVEHAHRRLVVHRDLKPSNILVDSEGRARLLDFGIGKFVDADRMYETGTGLMPLTPGYGAPEQILGAGVSTATDIYGLGVLLFELLAGCRPHERDDPTAAEIVRRVTSEDPPLPSAVARSAKLPWARRLTGDLDAIILRALRRDPDERYGSVGELAEDLRRYRERRPVRARGAGAGYALRRFAQRNRGAVAGAFLLLVTFLGGVGATLYQARERERAAARALAEARRTERISAVLRGMFEIASPFVSGGEESIPAETVLDRGLAGARAELVDDHALLSEVLHTVGSMYEDLGATEKSRAALTEAVALAREAGSPSLQARAASSLSRVSQLTDADEAWNVAAEALAALQDSIDVLAPLAVTLQSRLADAALRQGDLPRADSATRVGHGLVERYGLAGSPEAEMLLASEARGHSQAGRNSEAIGSLTRLAELQRVRDAHPDLLGSTLNSLAVAHRRAGNAEAAVEIFTEIVELLEALDPAHPNLIQVRANQASALFNAGRVDEAEATLRANVDAARARDPVDPYLVRSTLRSVGGFNLRAGRAREAAEAYDDVLSAWYASGDENPAWVAMDRLYLAGALHLSGQNGEAGRQETLAREVLERGEYLDAGSVSSLQWLIGRLRDGGSDDVAERYERWADGLVSPEGEGDA